MMRIAWWLWSECKGNWHYLNLIWGTRIYFAFLGWHQCSSRLVTVLLGTLWFSIKQIEASYLFDWENAIALHAMQGNLASSCGDGEVSCVFKSCGRNLGYILALRWGCPFETGVFSVKSVHLSRYEGELRNVFWAWHTVRTLLEVKWEFRSLFLFDTVILEFLTILKNCQPSSTCEAVIYTWLSSCQRHVTPLFEMKWRPRAFCRVSTGDSVILSSCDMNDEHAWCLFRELWISF